MAQWTDPSRTFLIQEVRGRRVLWDTTINDSNIKAAKAAAFAEVANVMNEAFPSSTKYTGEVTHARTAIHSPTPFVEEAAQPPSVCVGRGSRHTSAIFWHANTI
ncbi:hypothetical protein NECAME_11511 [Necator americanus]|uniref:MADF domain-containing protein n=1 Tax=Necator americanus TaxID=51031 RepID=W2T4Z0_NECAM|nr:hypothetical protein NECAME_11511 [Necator americanus]ETN76659.1 hypothetical protein NECAME_11511 [Necator americanus]